MGATNQVQQTSPRLALKLRVHGAREFRIHLGKARIGDLMFRVFRESETVFVVFAIDDQEIARPELIRFQQRG